MRRTPSNVAKGVAECLLELPVEAVVAMGLDEDWAEVTTTPHGNLIILQFPTGERFVLEVKDL